MSLETAGALADEHNTPVSAAKASARGPRPKDASSLILIDRSAGAARVLLGRRHQRHVFMPNAYVFPGGRRDPADSRAPTAGDLQPVVAEKLLMRVQASTPKSRPRALAVTAVRETLEETGLIVTPPADGAKGPDLSILRFFARAITPPQRNRRYDTRFFTCFVDEAGIDPRAVADSDELQDLHWAALDGLAELPLPRITRIILADLKSALADDPDLPPHRPAPFHYFRRGKRLTDML